jgi:heavy metal efflux system protein
MKTHIIFILCSACITVSAQTISIDQVIQEAVKNNAMLRSYALAADEQQQLKRTSFDLPKTAVSLLYGQYNSIARNDNNITVSQTIPFTVFGSQAAFNRSLAIASELKKAGAENELIYQVRQTYYHLAYLQARHELLLQQDSIYTGLLKSASLRFKSGETNLLEQVTAEAESYQVKNLLRENLADLAVYRDRLLMLTNSTALQDIMPDAFGEVAPPADTTSVSLNPALSYSRQQVEVSLNQKRLERARLAPDFTVGFFTQTLIGYQNINSQEQYFGGDKRFHGFQVGIALPLWFAPHAARIRAAEYNRKSAQSGFEYQQQLLQGEMKQAMEGFKKNRNSLVYYKTSALPNSALILRHAGLAFKNGEIGFTEYLLSVKNAISIRENYLRTLNSYNQSVFTIEFLSGNQILSHGNH